MGSTYGPHATPSPAFSRAPCARDPTIKEKEVLTGLPQKRRNQPSTVTRHRPASEGWRDLMTRHRGAPVLGGQRRLPGRQPGAEAEQAPQGGPEQVPCGAVHAKALRQRLEVVRGQNRASVASMTGCQQGLGPEASQGPDHVCRLWRGAKVLSRGHWGATEGF